MSVITPSMETKKPPMEVYQAFRKSILSKDDTWKALVAEHPVIKTPLVYAEGKNGFIGVY